MMGRVASIVVGVSSLICVTKLVKYPYRLNQGQ
jgi:hypothetical protein